MRIRLPFVLLALVVLLVAHQCVYMATYGWRGVEQALTGAGHDGYWVLIGGGVSIALVSALGLSLRRWLTLRSAMRRMSDRRRARIDWSEARVTVVHLAPRLAVAALLLFFIQENLEHYLYHGGHLPGMGVLIGPDYVGTLPIFAALAVVVAIVAAMLGLGLAALARLVETATGRQRPDRNLPRAAGRHLPAYPCSRTAPDLGRAPPALA